MTNIIFINLQGTTDIVNLYRLSGFYKVCQISNAGSISSYALTNQQGELSSSRI